LFPLPYLTDNKTGNPDFEEPARELFIWCVLNHKLEMAKFFWEEGKVTRKPFWFIIIIITITTVRENKLYNVACYMNLLV